MNRTSIAADLHSQTIERMNPSEASKFLGVAKSTLDAWRSQGKGPPFYRLANRVFYRRGDLTAFVEACKVQTAHLAAA